MSLKQWFSALLFIGFACSLQYPRDGQAQTNEKASSQPSDFSKEALVLNRVRSRIVAEADGTGTKEISAEVKMLAEAGVKAFAVLSFTYTSANEVVDIDYVRVHKPDGTVVKTPDYNIQDMPGDVTRTAPLYSDIHEKHVAVKGLAVGDTLEYLVRYRIVKPQVPGQFWFEQSFSKAQISRDEELEISVPSGKYVKVASPDHKPEIKEENGRKIYRWTYSNLIVPEKQPGEILRRIPPNPDVQVTTFATWDDVGRWYGSLQSEPLQVTAAIQKKADELTKGLKSNDEKIRAIYSFVALQFHYIGLDFGIGRYQPHAADDVLDNGYGDCKDKHTLLASLLKASGIESWPALIHTTRKLDPDVPSPAQFNHVITAIPQGDKVLWLDTTPEVSPFGLLLTNLRGKQALVIPNNKPPVLMNTPQDAPFPQQQSFTMEGKLDGAGTFKGHSQHSYHGDIEVALRAVFRQVPESQWQATTQRFSYGMNFGGEVSNVKVTPPGDLSKNFEISYDYERKTYGDWENRQITPPLPPLGVETSKDAKKPPEPVLLGGVGEIVYRAKLALPAGYSAKAPANVDLVRPYAEYHSTYRIEDGVLNATRRLLVKKSEVDLASWEDFRDFGKAISDDENYFIPLSGGDASSAGNNGAKGLSEADAKFREGYEALQSRDLARAEQSFKDVLAQNNKYQFAHYNLGLVLMQQGKLNDAVAEFRKEEVVSPGNSLPYSAAAAYLAAMGHRDEALEEWAKLLKADPKNQEAALKVSSMLALSEKNPNAMAVLEEAAKESPGSPRLKMAIGRAYIHDGDIERGVLSVREGLKETTETQDADVGLLNDAAYFLATGKTHLDDAKEFAEKAVAALDARSQQVTDSDDDSLMVCTEFPAAWDTLGWVYFQMGDFARAEPYLRAAWGLGQNGVSGDHLAQALEKLGKRKEAAHVFELALSATTGRTTLWGVPITDPPDWHREMHNTIGAHYQKLTGHASPPPLTIDRLPNGEWTKTPMEQLQEARKVRLSKTSSLNGRAEFSVVLTAETVEGVRYRYGDTQLKQMTEQLQSLHYPMTFPVGSKAKIVRRVRVTCNASSGCGLEMLPPGLMTEMSSQRF